MPAVQKNDLVAADYLLAYHANSSTLEPASGTTALTMAFSLAHVPLARMLMHYGGNPDVVDKTGNSARTLVKRNTQLKVCCAEACFSFRFEALAFMCDWRLWLSSGDWYLVCCLALRLSCRTNLGYGCVTVTAARCAIVCNLVLHCSLSG